jgi:hypothetical protein
VTTPLRLTPGIHRGIPAAAYFADPCPNPSLTQSIAKIMLDQSPRHAWEHHSRLNPNWQPDEPDYRKERAIGNAAHKLIIGRGKEIAVAPFADWRNKDAKKFRDDAVAAGHEPILTEHHEHALAMVAEAREQIAAVGWDAFDTETGDGEVVLVWEENGFWFRSMVDWLLRDLRTVYDYKSSGGSFAPHVVGVKLADDGWDIQAAMIERGLDRLDPKGAGRRLFRFVAQENYPPYALLPVELTEAHLTMGRKKLEVAIDLWRACITADKWPRYPARVQRPEYPGWMETRWLEREVEYAENGIGNNWGRELQAPITAAE